MAILFCTALVVMLFAGTAATPLPVDQDVATVGSPLKQPFALSEGCGLGEPIPLTEAGDPGEFPEALILEECPGIRPGARQSNGCTLNFVFQDDEHLYMGAAGHCVSFVGQRIGATGVGTFGTVVFRHFTGVGWDFALIQVDEEMRDQVDTNMCAWHGPWNAEPMTHERQPVHHYGWGVATNQNSYERARTGTIIWTSDTTVHFESYASGGDSGSPLTNVLGSALAILTHVQSNTAGDRLVYGTHIEQALALVHNAGFDVELAPGQLVEGVI